MSSRLPQNPAAKLRTDIAFLLGNTLGADPLKSRKSRSPIIVGFSWGIGYALLFCGLPWIGFRPTFVFRQTEELFWLSIWGSCYFACASALAVSTSSAISGVIERNILPALSERATIAIDNDVVSRFSDKRVSMVSLLVAAVAAAVSAEELYRDLKPPSMLPIGWVCCGYFILYITAARTTYIARFYGIFAAHLKIDSDRIYALDPAHSLQVARIAWIGQRVLLFWFGIVCLVATLFPLFSKHLHHFVQFVVPTASFFSVVFGTIVFLNSESDIRSVVKESSESTLQSTETEIGDLFNRRSSLDDLEWKRLNVLTSLHDKLVATGSYRSALLSGLSLSVPLVGPAVAAIWSHFNPK